MIASFDTSTLEQVCKLLGATDSGFTGTEIGRLLKEANIIDGEPTLTKWKRLYSALCNKQRLDRNGNNIGAFIELCMNPAKYIHSRELFYTRQNALNVVISFRGRAINEQGRLHLTTQAKTIDDALQRVQRLRNLLVNRNAHQEIFKYCSKELLDDNYFHAVFESIKGLADKVRTLSHVDMDGAELFETVFNTKRPILALNSLRTETEQNEQKGFVKIAVGLFGMIRNPQAHQTKISLKLSEQDALDIFSVVSFLHRRLDNAVPVPRY